MSRMERWAARVSQVLIVFALCGVSLLAQAQQSWPAYVVSDNAPVYKKMDLSSDVLGTLPRGAQVTVYFAVQSVQGNWCEIAVKSGQQGLGYIECSELHRGHAPPSAASGATNPGCENLVDQLMDASGITSALYRNAADYASTPALQRLSSKQRADVIAIIGREFNGSVMQADIRHGLVNECDPVNYAASLEALRTPVAARMIRLEVAATNPSARSPNRAYVAKMQEHPPSQERLAAIEELDRAFGSTDFLTDVVISEISSMSGAITGKSASQEQLDEVRERLAPELRHVLLMDAVAVYRSASDDDIHEYAALWESGPLRQFTETLNGVVLEAAEMRAEAVGAELKEYVAAQRGQRRAQTH
jgi:hypothetical protein